MPAPCGSEQDERRLLTEFDIFINPRAYKLPPLVPRYLHTKPSLLPAQETSVHSLLPLHLHPPQSEWSPLQCSVCTAKQDLDSEAPSTRQQVGRYSHRYKPIQTHAELPIPDRSQQLVLRERGSPQTYPDQRSEE